MYEDSPLRTCEICGKQLPSHFAINVILSVGSPGHPSIIPLQCDNVEHWTCSPACFEQMTIKCATHVRAKLERLHNQLLQHHGVAKITDVP